MIRTVCAYQTEKEVTMDFWTYSVITIAKTKIQVKSKTHRHHTNNNYNENFVW